MLKDPVGIYTRGWNRQHVYSVDGMVTGERKEMHVARISPYADESLAMTAEQWRSSQTLDNQGKLQTEGMMGWS